jgi:hypothetical protein
MVRKLEYLPRFYLPSRPKRELSRRLDRIGITLFKISAFLAILTMRGSFSTPLIWHINILISLLVLV